MFRACLQNVCVVVLCCPMQCVVERYVYVVSRWHCKKNENLNQWVHEIPHTSERKQGPHDYASRHAVSCSTSGTSGGQYTVKKPLQFSGPHRAASNAIKDPRTIRSSRTEYLITKSIKTGFYLLSPTFASVYHFQENGLSGSNLVNQAVGESKWTRNFGIDGQTIKITTLFGDWWTMAVLVERCLTFGLPVG